MYPNELRVGADVFSSDGHKLGELVKKVDFPLQYHAEFLGEFKERQATQSRLVGFSIAALIGVFLLLLVSFRSFRLAALGFLTLPSALVGGVLAAYFFSHAILSLGSLVGFFTIFGIAARNKIMLINHYQHLEEHEGDTVPLVVMTHTAPTGSFQDAIKIIDRLPFVASPCMYFPVAD